VARQQQEKQQLEQLHVPAHGGLQGQGTHAQLPPAAAGKIAATVAGAGAGVATGNGADCTPPPVTEHTAAASHREAGHTEPFLLASPPLSAPIPTRPPIKEIIHIHRTICECTLPQCLPSFDIFIHTHRTFALVNIIIHTHRTTYDRKALRSVACCPHQKNSPNIHHIMSYCFDFWSFCLIYFSLIKICCESPVLHRVTLLGVTALLCVKLSGCKYRHHCFNVWSFCLINFSLIKICCESLVLHRVTLLGVTALLCAKLSRYKYRHHCSHAAPIHAL